MTSIILMIGTTELILIAGVALLLFGGKKLPELMRGMGQGVKNFKEGLNSPAEQKEEEPEVGGTEKTDGGDKAEESGGRAPHEEPLRGSGRG